MLDMLKVYMCACIANSIVGLCVDYYPIVLLLYDAISFILLVELNLDVMIFLKGFMVYSILFDCE